MTGARDDLDAVAEANPPRFRHLERDNSDLRAETRAAQGLIGEKQDEILALGERLGKL